MSSSQPVLNREAEKATEAMRAREAGEAAYEQFADYWQSVQTRLAANPQQVKEVVKAEILKIQADAKGLIDQLHDREYVGIHTPDEILEILIGSYFDKMERDPTFRQWGKEIDIQELKEKATQTFQDAVESLRLQKKIRAIDKELTSLEESASRETRKRKFAEDALRLHKGAEDILDRNALQAILDKHEDAQQDILDRQAQLKDLQHLIFKQAERLDPSLKECRSERILEYQLIAMHWEKRTGK